MPVGKYSKSAWSVTVSTPIHLGPARCINVIFPLHRENPSMYDCPISSFRIVIAFVLGQSDR
jgi:hypothetical protein